MLAAAGVASRRDAVALIAAGKVEVNGQVVKETGAKVDPDRDHITVDGRPIPKDVQKLYIALNKPAGYVSTREDPHAENIVMDLVRGPLEARLGRGNPAIEGLHPVGRLDTQTEGLLLLTNDGEFTQALTHPRHGVPKVYLAEVRGVPGPEDLERLRSGIPLFGRRTLPARVRIRRVDRSRGTASLEVELREGRNQQIRRMLQAVGFPVTKLKRISIGGLDVERLRPKHWRFLTEAEVAQLLNASRGGIAAAAAEEPERRPRARGGQAAAGRKAERVPAPKPPAKPASKPPAKSGPSGVRGSRGPRPDGPAAGPARPHGGRPAGPPREIETPIDRRRGPRPADSGTGPQRPRGPRPADAGGPPSRPRGPRAMDGGAPPSRPRGPRTSDSGGPPPRPRGPRPQNRDKK